MQQGGTILWKTAKKNWQSNNRQEYAVIEADVLNMLSVNPKVSCVSKNGYVKGLAMWWNDSVSSGCMQKSFHNYIKFKDIGFLFELSEKLSIIAARRLQDKQKIMYQTFLHDHGTYNSQRFIDEMYAHDFYLNAIQNSHAYILYIISLKTRKIVSKTKSQITSPEGSPVAKGYLNSPSVSPSYGAKTKKNAQKKK